MEVKLKKLQIENSHEANSLSLVEKWYHDSFPESERRPWDSVIWLLQNDQRYKLYGIYADQSLVGLLSKWDFSDFSYIEHFALDPQQRGKGIGTKAVAQIMETCSPYRPVVLEVEPPKDDISSNRIDFYKRCGLWLHDDYSYLQPPYSEDLPWVELKLMSYPKIMQTDDLKRVTRILHQEVYKHNKDL